MSAVISPWSFYLRYNISALAISVLKIDVFLEVSDPGQKPCRNVGNDIFYSREFQCADLILRLSDRADCMWRMTFLYYHICFTFICSFTPVWLLNCRLHIVQSNIVSTINIIDIYVTLFSFFHKLFYTCTCLLGCRKILVKDE